MKTYTNELRLRLLAEYEMYKKPEWDPIKQIIEGKIDCYKEVIKDLESGLAYKQHNERIEALEDENKALKDKIQQLTDRNYQY